MPESDWGMAAGFAGEIEQRAQDTGEVSPGIRVVEQREQAD